MMDANRIEECERGLKSPKGSEPSTYSLNSHSFATVRESAMAAEDNLWLASGEDAMTVVLHDLLLFSCLAAFVTGIVIATATLII
jgi:hypothetical protein